MNIKFIDNLITINHTQNACVYYLNGCSYYILYWPFTTDPELVDFVIFTLCICLKIAAGNTSKMAVDVLSPDARKKVDELFLYWLSEPSTQELLRHELAKVCGLQQQRTELLSPTLNLRPRSPTARSITPPPPSPSLSTSNRSPKTPRASSHPIGKQPEAKALTNGVVEEPDGPDQPAISTEIAVTKTAAESSSLSAEKPTSTQFQIPTIVLPVEIIPQFYFPNGKLEKGKEREMEKVMVTVGKIFERYPRQEVPRKDFHQVVKVGV